MWSVTAVLRPYTTGSSRLVQFVTARERSVLGSLATTNVSRNEPKKALSERNLWLIAQRGGESLMIDAHVTEMRPPDSASFKKKNQTLLSHSLRSTPSSIISRKNSTSSSLDCINNKRYWVYIGVGSNMGDRYKNIATAISLLCDPTFDVANSDEEENADDSSFPPPKLIRTSFLHETAPMYVTDQRSFLNGALELETELDPHSLLRRLKQVEQQLGRNFSTIRNGPRPVDLDILFYEDVEPSSTTSNITCLKNVNETEVHAETATTMEHSYSSKSPITTDTPDLVIPHIGMAEREFVLVPLVEVAGETYQHPVLKETLGNMLSSLYRRTDTSDVVRVLPLPRDRMICFNETIIMGILNVTPDSFSDGGKWTDSVSSSVQRALEMVDEGAGIIDIGGESTRPGAREIPIEEQVRRVIPVIQQIRANSDIPISIDTRHAAVARAAIEAGADIVNDVSGGDFDPDMLPTVAELGVPIVLMHMRGTPETMQQETSYDDVVADVVSSLITRSRRAEDAGIPRWLQILDPGIGFAKDLNGNLLLLRNLASIRSQVGDIPILLGTSRKGFIGKLSGTTIADERDFGSLASVIASLCLGESSSSSVCSTIIRVHNVKGSKQGTIIMDAIKKAH